jgi:hypothetical protein
MRYYFSSCIGALDLLEELGGRNLLMSYAVDAKQCSQAGGQNVIIDSGAFTVFTKGISIDIDDYLAFCLNQPKEWTFINLDVIPPYNCSKKELERCVEQSFENYIYLKDKLSNVMPVYHTGEENKWLKKYLNETDYVGVGFGEYKKNQKVKNKFLEDVFRLTGTEYKVHGLGYDNFKGLAKYPFFSVDSVNYKAAMVKGKMLRVCSKGLYVYFRENIKKYLKVEKEITQLWELRGLKWE